MSVKKKTIRIKLSVFIHPSFVKKSYRYRGIPPRIKIKKETILNPLNSSISDGLSKRTEERKIKLKEYNYNFAYCRLVARKVWCRDCIQMLASFSWYQNNIS